MGFQLKSRNRPIPNGLTAYDSATNCRPAQHSDFESQCRQWQSARAGNPGMCKRYRVSADMEEIRNQVDAQLAQICSDNGWKDFIMPHTGGAMAQPPFPKRSLTERISGVAKAAAVSVEWISSGAEAVPQELANKRAEICVACPMNNAKGDWLSEFTVPAAAAIKKALEARNGMKLSTPLDDKLSVCEACDCVLRLKIHMPLEKILSKMPTDIFNRLDEKCWIRRKDA